ncbi:MAG: GH116 family glycosyl-hydrolase [Armatimonadota bacterium]|nr:GH116 family glycosyl-hydrolase [Armatimonadota bacterium]
MKPHFTATLVAALLLLGITGAAAAHNTERFVQMADNYGADKANTTFLKDTKASGGKDDFDYLALRDHIGPSGVPLGGIGVGCFDLSPDGRFTRFGLANIHIPTNDCGAGCFLSLWQKSAGKVSARRLVRDDAVRYGMSGYKHSTYSGLWPRATLWFDDGPGTDENVSATILAHSGLVPQNVKDSSLPIVWFEVRLTAKEAAEVSVAFSWEDLLGRNLRDPESVEIMAGQVFGNDARFWSFDGERWPNIKRSSTTATPCKIGGMRGALQSITQPWKPKKLTFQNYITQFAVLAEPGKDGEVSILPAFEVGKDDAWKSFAADGAFKSECGSSEQIPPHPDPLPPRGRGDDGAETALSKPDGATMASAVAVRAKLRKGEVKVVRFAVAWYFPIMDVDRKTAAPGSFWGKGDYGRWFHNYFNSIEELVSYGAKERERILKETVEWQNPILRSTLPDWLKFKIINSAYTMYTNTMLNKAGDFTVLEGGMLGLAGTMDQRISAHPFYQKFFTQLDRSEMQLFGDFPDAAGEITHFIGHYYVGMATQGGTSPTQDNSMLDNTGGWIIQLAKDCAQTGERDYLKRNIPQVRKGMAYLKSQIPAGREIPVGATTYDDYHHPPICSYTATMYLATLKAAAKIGEMVGDQQMVSEYNEQFKRTLADTIKTLWNGRFFAHGCEIDGANRRDDIMFTGQLGGQFISRYCGWGDVVPFDMVRASIVSQFKTSLSHAPDYYANKVWDLNQKKGLDMEGSQCWPFYLESYTAMAGIQAGYLDDGLDIMKHIQLVHMRKGWTWCQNLWNPGELAYMTAPVTWFITDVLAGTNLDAQNQTLYIAPVGPIEGKKLVTPVYFPEFWGIVTYAPDEKKASLRIIKTFGRKAIRISKLVSEPIGSPTSSRKTTQIPEFTVKKGATLDLSPYWEQISGAVRHEAALPRADEVEFIEVKP